MTVTATPDFATLRHAMVASQLRPNAVNDTRVVAAMAEVPREDFVPASLRAQAYRDSAMPFTGGRFMNPPIATGRLLTAAGIGPDDHVLIIGAATGYGAAVAALLAKTVVAVEEDAGLAAIARAALTSVKNVNLVEAPLNSGAPDFGPYDVLFIDGAVETVPEDLIAQLKSGGRVATGLVDRGVTRLATGVRSEGGFGLQDFADIECALLPGFARPRAFTF